MKKVLTSLVLMACAAFAQEHLITGKSSLSVDENVAKLQKILSEKNIQVFSVYEHSKAAKEANLELRDTAVVVFGAPQVGTTLMQCNSKIALDLPLKILFYKGKDGKTTVAYEDIKNVAKRYNAECGEVLEKLSKTQETLFKAVID